MGSFTKKERIGLLVILGIAMLISLILLILRRNMPGNSDLQNTPVPSSNVILVKDTSENIKKSSGKRKRTKSKRSGKTKRESREIAPDFRDMEEDTIPTTIALYRVNTSKLLFHRWNKSFNIHFSLYAFSRSLALSGGVEIKYACTTYIINLS